MIRNDYDLEMEGIDLLIFLLDICDNEHAALAAFQEWGKYKKALSEKGRSPIRLRGRANFTEVKAS